MGPVPRWWIPGSAFLLTSIAIALFALRPIVATPPLPVMAYSSESGQAVGAGSRIVGGSPWERMTNPEATVYSGQVGPSAYNTCHARSRFVRIWRKECCSSELGVLSALGGDSALGGA